MTAGVGIAPQQVLIAAPVPLVFEVLCTPAGGSPCTRDPVARHGHSCLGRGPSGGAQGRSSATANMPFRLIEPQSPLRIVYSHADGPFAGARELVTLADEVGLTLVLVSAQCPSKRHVAPWLLRLVLEQDIRLYLHAAKAAAEATMRTVERQDAEIEELIQVLSSVSQAQLLQATAAQEVAEWGHVGHGMGVARIAVSLATASGLAPRQVAALEQAAWVHDVGKVGLSRDLWGGRRILPSARRRVVEAHVSIGAELAARANMAAPVQDLILHHHERWDGTGYPQRLAGEAIPLRARILAIAECVDAMLRPSYRREALRPADVVCRLKQDSGRLWDPLLVAAVCHSLAVAADEKWTCNLPATPVPALNIAPGSPAAPKLSTCAWSIAASAAMSSAHNRCSVCTSVPSPSDGQACMKRTNPSVA